jgi:hypothetical protein
MLPTLLPPLPLLPALPALPTLLPPLLPTLPLPPTLLPPLPLLHLMPPLLPALLAENGLRRSATPRPSGSRLHGLSSVLASHVHRGWQSAHAVQS